MKTDKRIVIPSSALMLIMLIMLLSLFSSVCAASKVQEELGLWRAHILSKGKAGTGVALDSEHYRGLVQMGPNCLPKVFSAYGQEADPYVLHCYRGLIGRIAHFTFFKYSEKPLKKLGYEYQCTKDIPFLSLRLGEDGWTVLRHPQRTILQRDKLIQWWDQRESFLKRRGVLHKIRTMMGSTHEKFVEYDRTKAQEFFKLRVYGIYNIPYYLDIIDQDNNPIIFWDFLRLTNHPEFQDLQMTGDMVLNTRKVDSKYPTRQSKIKLICDWWNKASKTYTALAPLYSQIDRRVKKLCNQNP